MPRSSPDNQGSAGQTDVYWRRRVIALAAGIGVVGLIVWTVNGALGPGTARPSANVNHLAGQATLHPAVTTPSPTGTPSATAAGTPTAAGTAHGTPTGAPASKRAGPAPAAGGSGACRSADIVLSLSAAQYSYPAHALPQFEINVVSTASRACTFDVGARNTQLLIRAGGQAKVWDSADCLRPPGRQVTRLARGVPAVVRITWDRKTSAPGCRLPRKMARPGTYTATAYSGHLLSPTLIFVLSARGIAVP
jgi:hypothetical protein